MALDDAMCRQFYGVTRHVYFGRYTPYTCILRSTPWLRIRIKSLLLSSSLLARARRFSRADGTIWKYFRGEIFLNSPSASSCGKNHRSPGAQFVLLLILLLSRSAGLWRLRRGFSLNSARINGSDHVRVRYYVRYDSRVGACKMSAPYATTRTVGNAVEKFVRRRGNIVRRPWASGDSFPFQTPHDSVSMVHASGRSFIFRQLLREKSRLLPHRRFENWATIGIFF